MSRLRSFFVSWSPIVFYYALIFFFSSVKSPGSIQYPFQHFDKIIHFFEFGILGFLLARAFCFHSSSFLVLKKVILFVFLAVAIMAGLDEFHQYFVPPREADILDWLADVSGGVVFTVVAFFIYRRKFEKYRHGRPLRSFL